MTRFIYLDNQATTQCDPAVAAVMTPYLGGLFGNMHSDHAIGREAEAAVDKARAQVAALIGANPAEIVFTSGATEANNLAVKGVARWAARTQGGPRRVITLATEHKCLLDSVRDLAGEGFEPIILPVQQNGRVDLAALEEALKTPTLLVSVMWANNETGVLQDIAAISRMARNAGAYMHSDAAQAIGKAPVSAQLVDMLSISGHKIYGPGGVGALYVRRRPRIRLKPLFSGGGQENGLRPGTVPVMLTVGLGQACETAGETMLAENARIMALRDRLLADLRRAIPGLTVNGDMTHRLAGNLNITFPHATATALMFAAPSVCCSAGSACSAADIAPSYVLTAMGVSEDAARRSLRLSLGRFTSEQDVADAASILSDAHRRIEASSGLLARGLEA